MTEEEKKEKSFSFVDRRKIGEDPPEAAEAKKEPPRKDTAAPGAGEKKTQQRPPLPEIDFNFFVLSLSSSAMMQMGVIPNPATQQREKDLDMAKQTIDIIAMLKEKTEGNLNNEEAQFMEAILYDLRMKYVEVSKEIRQ